MAYLSRACACVFSAILLSTATAFGAETEPKTPVAQICDELRTVAVGERRPVIVRGRFVNGFELTVLFSPDCKGDFQPLTWIEMPLQVKAYDKLLRALKHGNQAEVVFRGYLFGPI